MTLEDMLKEVKKSSPVVLISFSRGKDAWGVWCALRDKIDFIPFHYYAGPPGLSFIEESLAYAEKKMGKKIVNLPAPMMYDLLCAKNAAYQPPQRILPLRMVDLQPITFEDIQDAVIEKYNLSKDTYTALGVRACDSARRALFFKTHGPISQKKKKFYPVYDWNKNKLMYELRKNDVKLPIDYKMFGISFDGLYYRFLKVIKDKYPEDYKKILDYFPLLDMEIYRYEKREKMGF